MLTKAGDIPAGRLAINIVLRLVMLTTPTLVLLFAAVRAEGQVAVWFSIGATLQGIAVIGLMAYQRNLAPAVESIVLMCYLLALGWVWIGLLYVNPDWYLRLAQATLVLVPISMTAAYTILQSGVLETRRALNMAGTISSYSQWPSELQPCRNLPIVKAFREVLQYDATPALELLKDSRAEVRIAALAALEFRQVWRPGQAETVLALLHRESVPEVRAAAVAALANTDDRLMVESLTNSLRDPDESVRRATAAALFWNNDRNWSWIRFGVRRALSEPSLSEDGPLIHDTQRLSSEAVDDLIAWSSEKGVISIRAVQCLMVHYARALLERPVEATEKLKSLILEPHSPPLLRIESARLLFDSRMLDHATLDKLLDGANPAPLRLIAAEGLLQDGPHLGAVRVLRDIAHLPNRDMAVSTAALVQRRLGIDLGLALGQPLPALESKQAADVTRRLMEWAKKPATAEDALEAYLPGYRRPSKN